MATEKILTALGNLAIFSILAQRLGKGLEAWGMR
jgi:hypothetical protein